MVHRTKSDVMSRGKRKVGTRRGWYEWKENEKQWERKVIKMHSCIYETKNQINKTEMINALTWMKVKILSKMEKVNLKCSCFVWFNF